MPQVRQVPLLSRFVTCHSRLYTTWRKQEAEFK